MILREGSGQFCSFKWSTPGQVQFTYFLPTTDTGYPGELYDESRRLTDPAIANPVTAEEAREIIKGLGHKIISQNGEEL